VQRGDVIGEIQCGAQRLVGVELSMTRLFAGFDGRGGVQEGREAVGVDDDDAFVVGQDHVARSSTTPPQVTGIWSSPSLVVVPASGVM